MTRPTLKEIGSCLRPIGLYKCEVNTVDCGGGWKPFGEIFAEPRSRQRLDHYGNDGEGWDDAWYDAWYEEYAYPMESRVKALIQARFGLEILLRLNIEVGEKGFIAIHYAEDMIKA